MAYSKNTWQSGDVVTSAKLNNIENGIANASGNIAYTIEGSNVVLSASFDDVLEMVGNGVIPFIVTNFDAGSYVIYHATHISGDEGDYSVAFNDVYLSDASIEFTATASNAPLTFSMG